MRDHLFDNDTILAWLRYFCDNVELLDITDVKVLDITGKNKNLIPTVESHAAVLVFTDAGHEEIFFNMWSSGLGDCGIWYNEGGDPVGPVKHDKLANLINRGINASAAMLIVNPDASRTYRIGMESDDFSSGSIRYVGSEIRAVLMNKLRITTNDVLCAVGSASIAVEAAMFAGSGSVLAVEYRESDQNTLEENVVKFGLQNVSIFSSVEECLADGPAPTAAMVVASDRTEAEIRALLKANPAARFVFYTVEFDKIVGLPPVLERCGLKITDCVQVAVTKVNPHKPLTVQPTPWLFCARAD